MFGQGLLEVFEVIGRFFLSLIDGMYQFIQGLNSIVTLSTLSAGWMPSAIYAVFGVSVTLIIVLRIIGR